MYSFPTANILMRLNAVGCGLFVHKDVLDPDKLQQLPPKEGEQ